MPKQENKREPPAREKEERSYGSQRDEYGHESRRHEPYDDPGEHLEIEQRRFQGGLPPTPELYALAREQWYALPGSVVRPSMDPIVDASNAGQKDIPEEQ